MWSGVQRRAVHTPVDSQAAADREADGCYASGLVEGQPRQPELSLWSGVSPYTVRHVRLLQT